MKPLVLVVAFLLLAVGAVCTALPGAMLAAAPYLVTTIGLYLVGALRIGAGVVMIGAASPSRYPRMLQAFGVLFIVAGVATPIFGVDRARRMMELGASQGHLLLRAAGLVILAVGAFIAHAVTPRRLKRAGPILNSPAIGGWSVTRRTTTRRPRAKSEPGRRVYRRWSHYLA